MKEHLFEICAALVSGLIIFMISRLFNRLDKMDDKIDGLSKEISAMDKRLNAVEVQLKIVIDYFMPQKKVANDD